MSVAKMSNGQHFHHEKSMERFEMFWQHVGLYSDARGMAEAVWREAEMFMYSESGKRALQVCADELESISNNGTKPEKVQLMKSVIEYLRGTAEAPFKLPVMLIQSALKEHDAEKAARAK